MSDIEIYLFPPLANRILEFAIFLPLFFQPLKNSRYKNERNLMYLEGFPVNRSPTLPTLSSTHSTAFQRSRVCFFSFWTNFCNKFLSY